MEIAGALVMVLGLVGVIGGFLWMIDAEGVGIPWPGALTVVVGLVALVVGGGLLLSTGETYEEQRDRIFDETHSKCMNDYESGRRVLLDEKGVASHHTYVCEGEAYREVEEELWND